MNERLEAIKRAIAEINERLKENLKERKAQEEYLLRSKLANFKFSKS